MRFRNFISACLLVLFSLNLSVGFSQVNKGKILKIKLHTIDKNADTVIFVSVELFVKGKMIGFTTTDFDGRAIVKICSTKMEDDSIHFQTTAANYQQKMYSFKISTDTTLTLILDEDKEMTKKKVDDYIRTYIPPCGQRYEDPNWKSSYKYKHCDGRVLTYQAIQDKHENVRKWDQLEIQEPEEPKEFKIEE